MKKLLSFLLPFMAAVVHTTWQYRLLLVLLMATGCRQAAIVFLDSKYSILQVQSQTFLARKLQKKIGFSLSKLQNLIRFALPKLQNSIDFWGNKVQYIIARMLKTI